ncbi:hypothetical protein B0H13DRAFT_1893953 [Mycena leptocephala]|nr:hypothetical protein B0H13DRAFT_1893953 [Mycena leptocephala]
MLGLYNSSLDEVLKTTTAKKGQAQVSALGFNISCGYVTANIQLVELVPVNPVSGFSGSGFDLTVYGVPAFIFSHSPSLIPNTLSIFSEFAYDPTVPINLNDSIYISTTTPVVDSQGHRGSPLIFNHQTHPILKNLTTFNLNSSQIQFFQCSKSLVAQTVGINSQSNTIISGSLYPNIYKNHSTWVPAGNLDFTPQNSTLLGDNLSSSQQVQVLELHDIENALSSLLAMVFWTGTHIEFNPGYIHRNPLFGDPGIIPILTSGNTTILQQEASHVQLNKQIYGDSGYGWSCGFNHPTFSLCGTFLLNSRGLELSVDGAGLLDSIWVWRQHQLSSNSLNNVQQPTEINLRTKGLIPLQCSTKGTDHVNGEQQQSATFGVLLGLAIAGEEHTVIFSNENQQTLSFLCKIGTMAFGMIYYTGFVYLTQKLAIAHAIGKHNLLTSTHDKISAWNGIGSAVLTLYKQLNLPASSLEIMFIPLYLATISVLQVTTPALVSVKLFSYSMNTTNGAYFPWIKQLDRSMALGLSNGSLYGVMETAYAGGGSALVSAVGFNISRGYIPGVVVKKLRQTKDDKRGGYQPYSVLFTTEGLYWPRWYHLPDPDTILIAQPGLEGDLPTNSIIITTQNSVSDSNSNMGFLMTLPHSNVTLQFLQCYQSLVPQVGRVDIGSQQLIPHSLYPPIHKHNSTWQAHNTISKTRTHDKALLLEGDYVSSGHTFSQGLMEL